MQPRAPVNINTAPAPVLAAVLRGISAYMPDINPLGRELTEQVDDVSLEAFRYVRSSPITAAQARAATAKIIDYRANTRPFGTWEEFELFCYDPSGTSVLMGGASPLSVEQAHALIANANPNAMLNKFNPDHVVWRRADKTDLVQYSTEFCFEATGYYEIGSLGRVLDGDREVLASAEIQVEVQVFETIRHTTQRDFTNASYTAATQIIAYYPESPGDQSFGALRAGPRTDKDGRLGIAPRYASYSYEHINGTPFWQADYWSQVAANNGTYPQLAAPRSCSAVVAGAPVVQFPR